MKLAWWSFAWSGAFNGSELWEYYCSGEDHVSAQSTHSATPFLGCDAPCTDNGYTFDYDRLPPGVTLPPGFWVAPEGCVGDACDPPKLYYSKQLDDDVGEFNMSHYFHLGFLWGWLFGGQVTRSVFQYLVYKKVPESSVQPAETEMVDTEKA